MKRFLVSILVPAAAAIAVVGSGFSVWHFGDKEVKKDSSTSLEVKNMLHIGTFQEMSGLFKLTLDQTEAGRTEALKGKTADTALDGLEKTGITLTNSNTAKSSTITYVKPAQANAVDQGTFGGKAVKVEIKTTFTIDATLAKWVKVSSVVGGGTLTNDGNVYTYTWKANDATSGASNAQTTLDLVNGVTWGYVEKTATSPYAASVATADRSSFATWEPLNADEYVAMHDAVEGKSITINTIAKLVA